MLRESDFQEQTGLFFMVGFIVVRNECLLETTLQHLLFGLSFVLLNYVAFLSFWPRLKRVRLEPDYNIIDFPQSSSLHTVNARGSIITLAGGFSSWHFRLFIKCFRRQKFAFILWENPFSFKELIGYVDLTVFREIWSEHSLKDMEQKSVGEFFYSKYFFRGGLFTQNFR